MTEFFHVDRRQTLDEGRTLELFQNPLEKFFSINDGISNYRSEIEDSEVKVIEERFPNGLSMHGLKYVIGKADLYYSPDNPNYRGERNGFYIEHMYEQIRRNSFPNKPSRFQSWFGFENLMTACNFPDSSDAPFDIYRVSPKDWIKLDMSLLKYGNYGKSLQNGRRYWNKEKSNQAQIEIPMEPPIEVKKKVETVEPPK